MRSPGNSHGFRGIRHRLRRGFTLIELTIAMVTGSMAGAMILALFNQQINFINLYRSQNFLTEEAPIISTYVSRIIGGADRFRLHDSVDDALQGRNPRTGPTRVVVFNFRQPDGVQRASILSFEDRGQGDQLYYYIVPLSGGIGEPEWSVTSQPKNVEFVIDEGILRMILTGPADEQVIYSGAMQK